jgi:uncharacterized membrane protein YeaQ/YmgE (transglycosylase-associated protein family)
MTSQCSFVDHLRSHRIYGLAIFDWTTSIIGAILIGRYIFHLSSFIHWILWIILWVIIGIVAHVIVKVPTMLGFYLGLNKKPEVKAC